MTAYGTRTPYPQTSCRRRPAPSTLGALRRCGHDVSPKSGFAVSFAEETPIYNKQEMKPQVSEHGLDGVEIFQDLEEDERARLVAELETLSSGAATCWCVRARRRMRSIVVVTGRFAVTLDGRREAVAELGAGQPLGEIAFLAGGPRTATVTALRDSLVLRLGRAEFEALSAKSPSIWRTLTVALARRVAEANVSRAPPPDPRPRTVAIIRAGGSELPPAFIVGLTRAFRRSNRTMLVRAEMAKAVLPANVRIDSVEATRALNALESHYDYVLFIAEHELTPWSEKAIRQADLVLAVGMHAADAEPNALERLAAELLPPARAAPRAAARDAQAHLRHRALARASQHRHAPSRCAGQRRRHGAALPLHQRHGARPRRLRRRRLLRGPHRPLQGADPVGPRVRHHGRHLGRRRHDGGLRHGRRTPTTSTAPRTRSSSPTRPCAATPGPATACSTTRTTTASSPRYYAGDRHRGPVDPLLRRLDQPVEPRPASPSPRRPVGRRARRRARCRCCCRPTTRRTGRCWSTAPSSTTCRSASCTS